MAGPSYSNLVIKGTGISEAQLRGLLDQVDDAGQTLEQHLSDRVFHTPEEVLSEICKKLKVDFIKDIPINDISSDMVRNIPINYAKNHQILPFKNETEEVVVLTTNPLNQKPFDDLRVLFGKRVKPLVTTTSRLADAINRVYEKSTAALEGLDDIEGEEYDLDDPVIDLLETGEDDAPVIKLVNTLLFRAVKEKA